MSLKVKLFTLVLGIVVPAQRIYAQGPLILDNPISRYSSFGEVVKKIISEIVSLAVPIVAIMILIGGFQIMTAGGNQEKVSAGKKTIQYAVIGFVIILMAQGIVSIVRSIVESPTGTPPQ